MSACTYSFTQPARTLLVAGILVLSGCGGGNNSVKPEYTHGQDAVDAANQAAANTGSGSIVVTDYENAIAVGCNAPAEEMQASILRRVNEARLSGKMCGSKQFPAGSAMGWNTLLADAAMHHATDMASNNFFNHTGSNGLTVDNRVERSGYLWLSVGENIAAGHSDSDQAMESWIESQSHCENIMNSDYSEVAVSCVANENSNFQRYWVMVLATPLPRP